MLQGKNECFEGNTLLYTFKISLLKSTANIQMYTTYVAHYNSYITININTVNLLQ